MVTVSVVIPTKDAGPEFRGLLESIRGQEVVDAEIIVIDSGSTDGTVSIAGDVADIVVEIPPEEFHHGRTRNRGAAEATGDVVVFTVQDALPVDDRWLPELVNPIEEGTADVTYGNQVAYPDAKPLDKFFYEYFYPDKPVLLGPEDTDDEADFYMENIFLSDVSSAISREVWEEFQFRDSVAMSEDKDFAYRVASAGHTIRYCPAAKVYHSHDYTLRSLFVRRYQDGKAFADIASGRSTSFVSDGLKYVWKEYSYLLQSCAGYWIPYAILYDLTYFVSFNLGKHHNRLPTAIDRRFDS